jgi:hypothetical protein
MTTPTHNEPASRLNTFALHAALALPLNMVAVPLSFFGAFKLRELITDTRIIFDKLGIFAIFAVLTACVMFTTLIEGLAIARAGRRHGVAWAALLIFPMGFMLTVLACDWLLNSPQLSLLHAAKHSIREHGFYLCRQLMSTLPGGRVEQVLMIIVMAPVFLVLGLFDILMMPFVPFTDPNFYITLIKLMPYFAILLLGSALPCWLLARRSAAR